MLRALAIWSLHFKVMTEVNVLAKPTSLEDGRA